MNERDKDLIEKYPILMNESFLEKYPKAVPVADFLNSVCNTMEKQNRRWTIFENLGISNVREYLELLDMDDRAAIELYCSVAKTKALDF